MGKSDTYLSDIYDKFKPRGRVALLGATKNQFWSCAADYYDRQLNNWDINDEWVLNGQYDTIICTRCAYFAKDPVAFMHRLRNHLMPTGKFFVDWGLGDHWRFENFKIGWVKDGEHEYHYASDNYLWSTFWSDAFLQDPEFVRFVKNASKIDALYTLDNIKNVVHHEVPSIIYDTDIVRMFDTLEILTLSLWEDAPQFYVFLTGALNGS